jgi:hypothetical protein
MSGRPERFEDENWGEEQLQLNIQTINKDLGVDNLKHTTSIWCHYDLYNLEYLIEHKARRCKHNTYDAILFNMNKINTFKKNNAVGKTCIIYFSFIDGLYKIVCDDNTITRFDLNKRGGRQDRGYNEIRKNKCYIPTDLLQLVEHR